MKTERATINEAIARLFPDVFGGSVPSYTRPSDGGGRRTEEDVERLRCLIERIRGEQWPTTCRSVFYQCVSAGAVDKTESECSSTVGRLLREMRRSERIPYGWRSDSTRLNLHNPSFSSVKAALEISASTYRRMFWTDQPNYVEVWSEKDTISGTIFPVTNDYDIPLMIARGFSSLTFLHNAAQYIAEIGKPTTILHLGDHDPSGRIAANKIEEDLKGFAPNVPIAFVRLAVTPEQIRELELPTRPTKMSKHSEGFVGESVEVDAIPATELRRIVRDAIENEIHDKAGWNTLAEISEQERQQMEAFAAQFHAA